MRLWAAIVGTIAAGGAFAQPISSESRPATFEQCVSAREQTIASLGVSPRDIIPVINTPDMTITKLCVADGAVLITCSRADKKMTVTRSANRAGCK